MAFRGDYENRRTGENQRTSAFPRIRFSQGRQNRNPPATTGPEKRQLFLVIEGVKSKPEGMGCVDNMQLSAHRLREEGVGQRHADATVCRQIGFDRLVGDDRRSDFACGTS